jgi:hypothetical protein
MTLPSFGSSNRTTEIGAVANLPSPYGREALVGDPVVVGSDHTLRMSVDDIGFMLDRLGRDCSALQFLRELTQNSLEAIERSGGGSGSIIWDVDWPYYDLTGVYKLCITDDGVGMTGEEMVKYINSLSASVHTQSHGGNFGVGAKIAAATRNHAGLVYLSWVDNVGYTIHLWRSPASNQYGLQRFTLPDGTYDHWGHLDDAVKPAEVINEHGTKVVLLGDNDEDDTMGAPKGAPSPSRWVARYLNTRYFRFPQGVVVKAREGWEHPRSDGDRNLLRTVSGQEPYLGQHSSSSGLVEITGAKVHWWVLKDEAALTQNSGFVASSGHIAALYQDELYEMLTSRAGVARLQQFGIIFGPTRVVLYVEPTNGPESVIESNTARTMLLLNNEPLPWSDWAAEFREKMPAEINDLMQEVSAGSSSSDHRQSIKERLKQIAALFNLSRYRPTPKGTMLVDEENLTVGGKGSTSERGGPSNGGARRPRGAGSGPAGSVYGLFLATEGGILGEAVPGLEPNCRWVSLEEGTRTQEDIEDRAAKYLPEQHLLLINGDFRVFIDMINRWTTAYENTPGVEATVRDVVREWFEQSLVETVMGVQSLKGSPEWDFSMLKKAWSEEALTAAVMPRYHTDVAIKRSLGAKLGTLKTAS